MRPLGHCIMAVLSRLVSVACLAAAITASAGAADWQLNGSAALDGSSIVLTQGTGGEAGSAFLTTPVTLGSRTPWSILFKFRIDPSTTNVEQVMGDGFTVTLADSPTLLGNGGSDLGAFGAPSGTAHYVAGIDTFNFGPSGSDPGEPLTPSGLFSFGNARDYSTVYNNEPVQYLGAPSGDQIRGLELSAFLVYSLSYGHDLGNGQFADFGHFGFAAYSQVGDPVSMRLVGRAIQLGPDPHPVLDSPLYIGFTAGNGLATDRHTILSVDVVTIPEPSTWLLFGLPGLAAVIRRYRI